ncbi:MULTISPECIES: hypothetical protein [Achromobacter]|uniref:Serine/threonine protein kinase n=1 Tax=Achromobacter spanius TaxID=217203 RepID=A0AAW3IAB1_9BURK|nr:MULTISPECIES: hypothetical protein [Achromobacter]AZS79713.1 hypothetical protein ELS24_15425 [Achromobacter spanius]KNE29506.1 hypothetical protein AFM18_00315 [Achromobacter spanius]MCD0499914.1 hypothetical protein [Achromobacter sp. MY14]MCW3152987.1 hypothetical protein [Achromobacter spanius]
MKFRSLTCALALAAGLTSAGAVLAQTATPTSPSNTPNDTTAAQPNRPLPPGQMAPAPNQTPSTGTVPPNVDKSGSMSTGKHSDQMPNKKREANDNVPRTPASGATPPPGYPNTGGSK